MRDRVHAAEALLERGRAHRGGREHLCPRLDVVPVRAGAWQVVLDEPHPLERDAVGEGMESGRAVRLEAVHEGVDAGRRRDVARQADGELGVEDHDARHHERVKDDLLLVRLLVEDHARAADLRARPGRGWHRNDRCDARGICPRPPVADVLEVPERSLLSRHEGNDLACIERGTPAEGDDAVVAARTVGGEAGEHVAARGVTAHGAEERRCGQSRERTPDHGRIDEPLVGHDERASDAGARARRGQFGDAAGPRPDRGRVVPVAAQHRRHGFNLK